MYKYLTFLLLLIPSLGFSQEKLGFQQSDSLTYQYYLKGEWKNLIGLSKTAFHQNIDSKFMRQRAGYAYLMTGDYTAAEIQFLKALEFDRADEFTQTNLYYAALNRGSENRRHYAGYLSQEAKYKLGIQQINPVSLFDTEFNLKANSSDSRSNQVYYRFGLGTELGYRLTIYQAVAFFKQTVSSVSTRQPEYVAMLNYTLSPKWQFKGTYHFLNTNDGYTAYPGNLGLLAITRQLNRFNLEANGSILKSTFATTRQFGLKAGVVFPGRSNIYLTSALTGISEDGASRVIYSQGAGLKCTKNLWAEGYITIGNLKNYNTFNGLYIYNSVDPSIFRTGCTLSYFLGKHLALTGNFTFDQQQIESTSGNSYYYQYSYSGGIKWRL
jgi:hypothetical protein